MRCLAVVDCDGAVEPSAQRGTGPKSFRLETVRKKEKKKVLCRTDLTYLPGPLSLIKVISPSWDTSFCTTEAAMDQSLLVFGQRPRSPSEPLLVGDSRRPEKLFP